jgi:copper-containing nitrite reductase
MARRSFWRISAVVAAIGLLTASGVSAHTEHGGGLLAPSWTIDELVNEVRETRLGGMVSKEQMTGQVREFYMHASEIEHEIKPGVVVKAWAFGLEGQPATVPGPTMRAKVGDLVRIHLTNKTTQPHSIHSHGVNSVDELNDGVPHVTGAYVMPGQTFTYEYVVAEAGTHWYHCHVQTSLHQQMGMYGAIIVEENEPATYDREFVQILSEWDSKRDPSDPTKMPVYDYFMVNGKAGGSVPDMIVRKGEVARIRFINAGFDSHYMHLHGTQFVIIAKDGAQLPLPQRADTLNIAPGETYDLLVQGREGVWPWHDHNSRAVTDAGVYPGGMLMHVRGSEETPFNPEQDPPRYALEGHIHADHAGPYDYGYKPGSPLQGDLPGGRQLGEMKGFHVTPGAVKPDTGLTKAVAFDAAAPMQAEPGKTVDVTLEARRVQLEVAPGDVREVWSFGGSVPAPAIRVTQGDTVRITLVNRDPDMEHGLDFHAGQMDSGTYHAAIKPGESATFEFKTHYPGVFLYHCSASPVLMHVANGMFGVMIVDPPDYKPEGKEYVLIQHEWYKAGADLTALLEEKPVAVVFNGTAGRYMASPLTAAPGEKVRFYFANPGPNNFAAFHVIGTIFDTVYLDGNPFNVRRGVQTVTVPPGGALITDLYAAPGTYPVLTHALNDASTGALGILQVGAPSGGEHGGH